MTYKEKIREKVVEMVNSINPFIPDEDGKNSDYEAGKLDAATQVLQIIDSLEEPASEKKCMFIKDSYTDEDRKVLCEDCKEKCEYSKKEEPASEDLGGYINELSKQFPEVSFAKLSRIVVRVSRWQQNQDVKNKLPKVTDRIELDEYAYQCAYDMSNDWAIDNPTWKDVEDACKLGAKWQKEQMMAKAFDGVITFDYYGDDNKTYGCIAHDSFCLEDFGLKDRDKVRMIFIKED